MGKKVSKSVLVWLVFVLRAWACTDAHLQTGDNIFVLESYPSYSVVLPIQSGKAKDDGLNSGEVTSESFVVQSPRFHRVMAVIQFLNLQPRNDFTCGNYLQFQDGADKRSDKICGNFDPEEKGFDPASLIGPRSYLSSRETLKVTLVNPFSNGLTSYARIAFTAFREDCYFSQPKNVTGGSEGGGVPRYRPCEYSMSQDGIGRQCIVSNLFCDEVLNCGGIDDQGTDFGQDESQINCPHVYHLKEAFSSTMSNNNNQLNGTEVNERNNSGLRKGKSLDGDLIHSGDETIFRKFFDEREEHLANIFKSAIIGFVGICTLCILVAFVVTMFCLRNNNND